MLRRVLGSLGLLGVGLIVVLAIAALQVRFDQTIDDHEKRIVEARLAAAREDGVPRALTASATVGWSRVPRGESIPVSVLAVPRGGEEVSGISAIAGFADASLPSRLVLSPCAEQGSPPRAPISTGVVRLCGRLPPVAERPVGEHRIQVVLSWQEGDVERTELLDLGPVTIYDPAARWRAGFVVSAVDLLKGLALPMALLVIGWLFKQQQEERQQLTETWNIMLPLCQEYSEQYYTPALAALSGVRRNYDKGRLDEALYYYVGLLAHMLAMARERGGFFLKDRMGERVVADSWSAVLRRAKEMPSSRTYWRVVDAMDRHESLLDFVRRFDRTQTYDIDLVRAFKEYRAAFAGAWKDRDWTVELEVMKILSLVLSYELNSVHYHWYSSKETFPEAKLQKSLVKLQNARAPRVVAVREALESYLKHRPSLATRLARLWRRPTGKV